MFTCFTQVEVDQQNVFGWIGKGTSHEKFNFTGAKNGDLQSSVMHQGSSPLTIVFFYDLKRL